MNPICQVDINSPECQQWRSKVYAKCKDLLGSNAPNEFSMWWLYDTPAVYKDVNFMTAVDCHKLKRQLPGEEANSEESDLNLVKAVGIILALAASVALFIFILCGMKTRPRTKVHVVGSEPEQEAGLPERPHIKKKKKPNFKRWMHGSCRLCMLHSEAEARKQELKSAKQETVRNERSQLKLAVWNKSRERIAQRKKERLERRQEKEHDRVQRVNDQN